MLICVNYTLPVHSVFSRFPCLFVFSLVFSCFVPCPAHIAMSTFPRGRSRIAPIASSSSQRRSHRSPPSTPPTSNTKSARVCPGAPSRRRRCDRSRSPSSPSSPSSSSSPSPKRIPFNLSSPSASSPDADLACQIAFGQYKWRSKTMGWCAASYAGAIRPGMTCSGRNELDGTKCSVVLGCSASSGHPFPRCISQCDTCAAFFCTQCTIPISFSIHRCRNCFTIDIIN